MASYCTRNLVQRSSNTARTLLFRGQSSHSVAAGPSKLSGLTPTIPRPSPRHRSFLSLRLPVELGCGESLMPLHSVTASALLNSMLSSKVGQWGFLSEDYDGSVLKCSTGICVTFWLCIWIATDIREKWRIYVIEEWKALQRHYNRTFKGVAGKNQQR
ncbi:UNVERIFIED_CONTAM: hypothetical protein Sradi_4249400 [Sesamum radiatum]|uniref:Protein NUCLEAR FUSION DEFECTIVE 6, chloroplastic/mitochondrial-like n=1 Tax=Sesamum radiatum TaxID=300843 RepID=A0AAW2P444_SESRA